MTATTLRTTYPLIPLQEGMLFHGRLELGVYVQQLVVTLPEAVDADALRRAWQLIARRHAVLRTSFPSETEQTVAEEIEVPFEVLDQAARDSTDWDAWLVQDRRRGFDVAVPPLWRLTLVRRWPAEHILVWTFHHALLDGRSHRRVLEEAFVAYEAFREGREPPFEPARPFREHVEWLGRQDRDATERYWRGVLAGFETPTTLNVSYPQSFRGRNVSDGSSDYPSLTLRARTDGALHGERVAVIPESTAAVLKTFARENGVTPTTLVHAAWAILLARYGGQTDVVFGGTRSGGSPDHKDAVGLLVNTLPVRARVDGDKRLCDLLAELRAQWRAGRDFVHAAPVDIQAWSGQSPGTPLYETIVVTENYDLNETLQGLGGPWATRTIHLHEAPHYPLALSVALGREIHLRLLYDRRRIDDVSADRLLGHLQTLLEAVPTHAAAPLGELPMLTAAERRQIVFDWNETAGEYPRDRRLEHLFEEQADRTPDAVAVIHEGQSWTHRELDERANRLARHLAGLGAGPGKLVAVCMNRSADMLVAVLAILKAGAAYVPLDPANPKERLAFLLGDTAAVTMVTQVRRIAQLPELSIPVVCIDADWPTIGLHSPGRPERQLSAEEMAYVIYTSGSTGQPKGVVLRHRAVVNTIDWINKTFGVGPGDRVLWVTSLCFDLSVYDIFGVLAAGGSVRVATGGELRNPERLTAVLAGEPITIWDSAPSLLSQLAPHFEKVDRRVAPLRLVMLSGDWIPVALPDQVRAAFPATRVVSLGGATEAAIWSNWYPVEKVDPAWASIPYGRPIRNARYYLLDVHGQPAPVGVPAELFIAGDCVAKGYWNRPELTAERFIPISNFRLRIAMTNLQLAICNLQFFIALATLPGSGRRDDRVSRPAGQPGQDPRLPHRTRRGRGHSRETPDGRTGGRGRCTGRGRRETTHRLRRTSRGTGDCRRGRGQVSAKPLAGIHGAGSYSDDRRAAAELERQSRPQGPREQPAG